MLFLYVDIDLFQVNIVYSSFEYEFGFVFYGDLILGSWRWYQEEGYFGGRLGNGENEGKSVLFVFFY